MNLVPDIWRSFRALPRWVQIWVALILVPINMASLWFVSEPKGILIATLAVGGLMPNIVIMVAERGLSKMMALPHLVIWMPLLILLWSHVGATSGGFHSYLWLLLAVDGLSLAFDIPDAWKWWKGDRAIAGK